MLRMKLFHGDGWDQHVKVEQGRYPRNPKNLGAIQSTQLLQWMTGVKLPLKFGGATGAGAGACSRLPLISRSAAD